MSKLGLKILKMVGLISIVSMSLLIATYLLVFQTLFNNLKAEAQKDIKAAISVIDGDKLEKIIQENSMDSPEYNEVYESMMKFKSDKNIKYFYTLVKKGDNKTAFAVDAAITEQAQIGDEYDLTPEIAKAFDGSINYTEKPYTDEYGTVLSAYAPIKNSKGSIIAVAAVDKDVAIFQTIKDSLFKSFIVLIVVNILLSLAISFIFSRRVTNDIKKINGDLNRMALGDLTGDLKINSRDEIQSIADSINNFRLKTSQTVAIVKDSCDKVSSQAESLSALSEEMTSASNEVASTIHSVSIVANNQAEELINVDKSVSTFSSKIETSSNSIEKLNRTIEEVETKAKISSNELFNLENSIRDINMLFEQVGINIKDLSTDIVRISEITNLINSIADQTNLLALNAAIEAARAGEQGRGFSVVADEIRKLAEQSKESSLNINNLLQGISDKNDLVITTADHVNNEFKGQLGTINHSINSFKEIVASIEDVLPAINTVNLFMKQINSERSDIVTKVDKTASLAQDISASSEVILSSSEELSASTQEVASAALNLNQMTENMNRAVNYFKV